MTKKNLVTSGIRLKKANHKIMENMDNDIKKPEKEKLEVLKETPESVKETVIENAKKDINMVKNNTEIIKTNLDGVNDNPEAELVIDENEIVTNEAEEKFRDFTEDINDIESNETEIISLDSIWDKISNDKILTEKERMFIFLKIKSINIEEGREPTEEESKIFQIGLEMEKKGYSLSEKQTEETINDFENKMKSEIKEAVELDEDSKKFNEKDQKGKEAEISERKEKLEGNIREEGIEIGKNINEMEEQMKNIKKDLDEKFRSYLGMEKELNRICATEGILEQKDKEEIINVFKLLRSIYSGALDTDKISFLAETMKENKFDPNDPDSLINSYNQRNFNIKQLEEVISSLDVEIEKLEKGEDEAFSRIIEWAKSHPKEIALLAGIAGGIILAPFIAEALAGAGVGAALETGIPIAIKGTLVGGKAALLGLGKIGVASGVLTGLLIKLMDEKNRDSFMKWFTGKSLPSWASWGLREDNKK